MNAENSALGQIQSLIDSAFLASKDNRIKSITAVGWDVYLVVYDSMPDEKGHGNPLRRVAQVDLTARRIPWDSIIGGDIGFTPVAAKI